MTEPFVGEIQIFGFYFAPANWAFAAGQTMPLRQFSTLYSLYGVSFGGDGSTTFQLPNLAARQGCGAGQGPATQRRSLGQSFGSFNVGLTSAEMPMHNHIFSDYQPGEPLLPVPTASSAVGYAVTGNFNVFGQPGATVALDPNAVGVAGNGAPHPNSQPYLGLNYSVALIGNYPQFD